MRRYRDRVRRGIYARPYVAPIEDPILALDSSAILDKSATLAKVGALQNVVGAPSLTDGAGGRFLLLDTGAGYEIRCGLVATDRAANASHDITVTDDNGAHVLPITVTAISAGTGTGGSAYFGRRNGEQGQRYLTLGAGKLSNLFGNRNTGATGGPISGGFAFRSWLMRAQAVTGGADLTSLYYVMGTDVTSGGRSFSVRFCGHNRTSAQGWAGRYVFFGADYDNNPLGNYAINDADGAPTGLASGRAIRSAVIPDDEPRLVCLVWDAATTTFTVLTIKLDGTVEVGDVLVNAPFKGLAAPTNTLMVGRTAGSTTSVVDGYFPGAISDLMHIKNVRGTNSEWAEVAKGRTPTAVFTGANVGRHWALSSATDLAQTAGTDTAADFTASNTGARSIVTGPALTGAYDGTDGIAVRLRGDGNGAGVSRFGSTASFPVLVTLTGATTDVEARFRRKSDGHIASDWSVIGASKAAGAHTLASPALPVCLGYVVDVRRADKPSLVVTNREAAKVGVKVWTFGQSQMARIINGSAAESKFLAAQAAPSVSLVVQHQFEAAKRPVDVFPVDNIGDCGDGLTACVERLTTVAPNLPVILVAGCHEGEGIGSFTGDTDPEATGNYKLWGDNATLGSGLFTDLMLATGKDFTLYLHNHGTADAGTPSTYQAKMQALYLGTGSQAGIRSFAGASVSYPIRVVSLPLNRHTLDNYEPYAVNWSASAQQYQDTRINTATWAPAGMTAELGAWVSDIPVDITASSPHQSGTDVRGEIRYGHRMAMAILKGVGVTTYNPNPAVASIVRTSSTVLTVTFNLTNGGSLITGGAASPVGSIFGISEDTGTTWAGETSAPNWTVAITGANTCTITKTTGTWAAAGSLRVRHCWGHPLAFGLTPNRATQSANENTAIDGMLYESRADTSPSSGSGYVQGVPISPTVAALAVA